MSSSMIHKKATANELSNDFIDFHLNFIILLTNHLKLLETSFDAADSAALLQNLRKCHELLYDTTINKVRQFSTQSHSGLLLDTDILPQIISLLYRVLITSHSKYICQTCSSVIRIILTFHSCSEEYQTPVILNKDISSLFILPVDRGKYFINMLLSFGSLSQLLDNMDNFISLLHEKRSISIGIISRFLEEDIAKYMNAHNKIEQLQNMLFIFSSQIAELLIISKKYVSYSAANNQVVMYPHAVVLEPDYSVSEDFFTILNIIPESKSVDVIHNYTKMQQLNIRLFTVLSKYLSSVVRFKASTCDSLRSCICDYCFKVLHQISLPNAKWCYYDVNQNETTSLWNQFADSFNLFQSKDPRKAIPYQENAVDQLITKNSIEAVTLEVFRSLDSMCSLHPETIPSIFNKVTRFTVDNCNNYLRRTSSSYSAISQLSAIELLIKHQSALAYDVEPLLDSFVMSHFNIALVDANNVFETVFHGNDEDTAPNLDEWCRKQQQLKFSGLSNCSTCYALVWFCINNQELLRNCTSFFIKYYPLLFHVIASHPLMLQRESVILVKILISMSSDYNIQILNCILDLPLYRCCTENLLLNRRLFHMVYVERMNDPSPVPKQHGKKSSMKQRMHAEKDLLKVVFNYILNVNSLQRQQDVNRYVQYYGSDIWQLAELSNIALAFQSKMICKNSFMSELVLDLFDAFIEYNLNCSNTTKADFEAIISTIFYRCNIVFGLPSYQSKLKSIMINKVVKIFQANKQPFRQLHLSIVHLIETQVQIGEHLVIKELLYLLGEFASECDLDCNKKSLRIMQFTLDDVFKILDGHLFISIDYVKLIHIIVSALTKIGCLYVDLRLKIQTYLKEIIGLVDLHQASIIHPSTLISRCYESLRLLESPIISTYIYNETSTHAGVTQHHFLFSQTK